MNPSDSLASYAATQIQKFSLGAPVCKICKGSTRVFDIVDFNRQCALNSPYPDGLTGIPVYYHKCTNCQFLFTIFFDDFSPEQWVNHVYNADYARIDPEFDGTRALRNVPIVKAAMKSWWRHSDAGCDYGGGKGLLAAELRKQNYTFDSTDPFGEQHGNPPKDGYSFVTAFEVLEHFPDPTASFDQILRLCNTNRSLLLVSTNLASPKLMPGELASWWYAAPRNGHIALYAENTMKWMASARGLEYRRITQGLHLFGRGFDLSQLARHVFQAKVMQKLRLI